MTFPVFFVLISDDAVCRVNYAQQQPVVTIQRERMLRTSLKQLSENTQPGVLGVA